MRDANVRARLRDGHHHVVAECGGRIVGVAALRLPSHLYYLFVAEAVQRRGIARRLWEAVRERADPAAPVTVNASRHALPAYLKLGFEPLDGEHFERGLRYTPMAWRRR